MIELNFYLYETYFSIHSHSFTMLQSMHSLVHAFEAFECKGLEVVMAIFTQSVPEINRLSKNSHYDLETFALKAEVLIPLSYKIDAWIFRISLFERHFLKNCKKQKTSSW